MQSIDPSKIFVVLVVALIVLGPEKLPRLARQLGEAWAQLAHWRQRLEGEVRDVFPDLPSPGRIVDAARSPLRLLDHLAAESGANADQTAGARPGGGSRPSADDGAPEKKAPADAGRPRASSKAPVRPGSAMPFEPGFVDDPSMN